MLRAPNTNFTGATNVTFGSEPATSFKVVSDTKIQAVTPSSSPGSVAVSVAGPQVTVSSAGTYSFQKSAQSVNQAALPKKQRSAEGRSSTKPTPRPIKADLCQRPSELGHGHSQRAGTSGAYGRKTGANVRSLWS
ncbi:MAG: IPT/TIG domain-containing protein [Actinobacteria bacterium]|nr:IPT/TIG domain-containing protein [Actinomycetota bacterium]